MKTIGIIGGLSWHSSVEYYRIMNELAQKKLGGAHSAKCVLYSVDFEEFEALRHQGRWEELKSIMIDIAQKLHDAGADFLIIGTNTMHMYADAIEEAVHIKILHIADATGEKMIGNKIKKVALLGTKYTMQGDFYQERLKSHFDIDVIIPNEEDCEFINHTIYSELVKGVFKKEAKEKFINIINKLMDSGAEGVILGCTEIPLLIKEDDIHIPMFNTTKLHAESAMHLALK